MTPVPKANESDTRRQRRPNASLSLKVLETCVKNCGHRFHVLVSSQDFVESVLVRTILPKNNPPAIVHDKVLTLIQVSQEERVLCTSSGSVGLSVSVQKTAVNDDGLCCLPLPSPGQMPSAAHRT